MNRKEAQDNEREKRKYRKLMKEVANGEEKAIDRLESVREAREISKYLRKGYNASWTGFEKDVLLEALEKAGPNWEDVHGLYVEAVKDTENYGSRSIMELKAKAKAMKVGCLEKNEQVPAPLHCVPVEWPRKTYGKKHLRPQQRIPVDVPGKSSEDEGAFVLERYINDEGVHSLEDSRKDEGVTEYGASGWENGEGVNLDFPLRTDGSCVAVKDDSSCDGEPEAET
ncbi:TTAGGG repeat binding factor [Vermiconidia calcicola]|uniref:TTAGGG repeat binding factor n=1 Tax=Vermiconidia calcicola TaxID=1690605 RepID=A0ACC3NF87_9PEZI|nr:TTAGGG repeat binding factor [Vermiconidia calcicola]